MDAGPSGVNLTYTYSPCIHWLPGILLETTMHTRTIGKVLTKVPRARYALSRKTSKTITDSLSDTGE